MNEVADASGGLEEGVAQNPFALYERLSPDDYTRAAAERDKTFDALLVFIEWRHKVMLRFMFMVAGLAAAWHYLGDSRWQLQAVVLAVGAVASATMTAMDAVNAGLLYRLYERGVQWERLMFNGVGVFGAIRQSKYDAERWSAVAATAPEVQVTLEKERRLSYGQVIKFMYGATALAFAVALAITLALRK